MMRELIGFNPSYKLPLSHIPLKNLQRNPIAFQRTKAVFGPRKGNEKRAVRKEKVVVKVDPRPQKNLAGAIIGAFERMVISVNKSSKTVPFLAGNFGPVAEEVPPVTDLPVTGHLPDCLNGAFMRIGPNPYFTPLANYHWFDGDGMINCLRIKNGKPTYVSRYVNTSRLKQEKYFRSATICKIGDIKGIYGFLMILLHLLRVITNVLDSSYGFGTANTALVYHHGSLLALSETDKPYVIKITEDDDIETVGLLDYDRRLNHAFTAHPKIDPVTGDLFSFGNQLFPPYLIYRVISQDGIISDSVPITLSNPVMMHDFAITENYAVFMDLPLFFKPKRMVTENEFAFMFDKTKKARFGILPRYAKNEDGIRWFELPSCFILHTANAWEEGDEVVLIVCRFEWLDLEPFNMFAKEALESYKNQLYEMRFNMKTGLATQKQLSVPAVDFPRINENYIARKQRYVYTSITDNSGKIRGVAKFDLVVEPYLEQPNLEVGGNVVAIYALGDHKFGSEVTFVPRGVGKLLEEDDGYLALFVYDENEGKSYATIIDARTMSAEPVATVELPQRVPFGFHTNFVFEEQIKEQIKYTGYNLITTLFQRRFY